MAENEEDDFSILYKVVVIGDSGVGKTQIINRFTQNEFTADSKVTIAVEFGYSEVTLANGTQMKVQIWDTAGQERFKAIARGYYRGAVGALIVFDITKAETFKNVETWLGELNKYSDPDITLMMVGNKSDMKSMREVSTQDATKYAKEHNLLYIETSAKDGEQINEAFQQTMQEISERKQKGGLGTGTQKPDNIKGETIVLQATDGTAPPPKKGGCCGGKK